MYNYYMCIRIFPTSIIGLDYVFVSQLEHDQSRKTDTTST